MRSLRAVSAETLTAGADINSELSALATGQPINGVAGSIVDGKFLVETPQSAFKEGRWAKVPIIIGANNRDLATGVAKTKDDLFASFGPYAEEARALYDPHGVESLDELKQQVFADRTMTEPVRYLADMVAKGGQPVWVYRFSYVPKAARSKLQGTLHGLEIPFIFDMPQVIVGDKMTAADKTMGTLASGYWVSFRPNRRPEWRRPPLLATLRSGGGQDYELHQRWCGYRTRSTKAPNRSVGESLE